MTTAPTGNQYRLTAGRVSAVVTEVGATLRSLRVDDVELLHTFGEDELPTGSKGKHLVPWPNRVADGRYTFEGVEHQLDITEVPRHTALHGLNHGRAWQLVAQDESSVTQRETFYPENGWDVPFTVEITSSVSEEGLLIRVTTTNAGSAPMPYGYGAHPYFAFDQLEELTVGIPFDEELMVDDERLLPIRLDAPTAEHDFRTPRQLSGTEFDTAFKSPTSSEWAATLTSSERTLEIFGDETTDWLQVYTNPTRDAIAVEPMTCGPDAFNEGPTHDGVQVLEPGESTTTTWGVRVR